MASIQNMKVSVAILGGGILGTALAYHLRRDHSVPTVLFDQGTLSGGASGKAAGIVSSQCWNSWDIEVIEETRKEFKKLGEPESDTMYQEVGGITSASTPENVDRLKNQLARVRDANVEGRIIDRDNLSDLYPGGNFKDIVEALYTPHDAVVQPTDLTLLYARLATENGASIESEAGPVKVRKQDGNWILEAGGRTVTAEDLVIACGAWSKKVLAEIGHVIPLAPYLTRACLLKASAPSLFPFFHDSSEDVYLRPFPRTDVLLGDGTELKEVDPDHMNPSDDTAFLENVSAFLSHRFPLWAEAPVEMSWWGVCSSTPDRRPLVGHIRGEDHLIVAAGFNGFGIMRGGAVGRRLSDAIVSGKWNELKPCDPKRFSPNYPRFDPQPGFTLD
jgi:glycine/D-amino acid oxidase-like deaminating enzyme